MWSCGDEVDVQKGEGGTGFGLDTFLPLLAGPFTLR
jgi:hypothetical protein